MSSAPQHVENEPSFVGVQPDRLPLGRLFVWVGLMLVVLIGTLIGLWQFFAMATDAELKRKDLAKPSAALASVRKRAARLENSYERSTEHQRNYRIPVERAVDILVQHPERIKPRQVAAPPTDGGAPMMDSSH